MKMDDDKIMIDGNYFLFPVEESVKCWKLYDGDIKNVNDFVFDCGIVTSGVAVISDPIE
jgi:hypothetical protein